MYRVKLPILHLRDTYLHVTRCTLIEGAVLTRLMNLNYLLWCQILFRFCLFRVQIALRHALVKGSVDDVLHLLMRLTDDFADLA